MLDSLKQVGESIGRGLNRTWENLTEGWHELLSRSNEALTHFARNKDEVNAESSSQLPGFPSWSLLAGEVEETDKEILVRIEVPGMEKEDFQITVDGNILYLSGVKHFEHETHGSAYHVMERAYGAFQRAIPLPRTVNTEEAKAGYKNGVLKIHLPKVNDEQVKNIPVF
ncbi:MAG: Hsp20/alpha crystallin family protein [Nitrosomonas sp.]|nr:Hsp20/alpha crystallin family protein [Nitrosomonas sp.]MDP1950211.1 Hsp20/alpha crystallin family protein [Nitrosomonas sp.]